MTMIEITYIPVGMSLIWTSGYLLYLTKDIKVLLAWSIALAVVQIMVGLWDYEIKWMVLAILPFYFFAIIYMMIKLRMRINKALKRIEEIEREEKMNQASNDVVIDTVTLNESKEVSHGHQRHLPQ